MSKKLHFALKLANGNEFFEVFQRFLPEGRYVLNSTEWMGKEPRSCAVTSVNMSGRSGNEPTHICNIDVSYRPKGYISYQGNTKYDGWTAMMLDRMKDGTLLDGHGQPLKDGDPPVHLPFEVFADVDYNELDFGQFLGESDVEGMRHITHDQAMEEVMASVKEKGSMHGRFTAPRRSRPLKKIILTSNQTQTLIDGFGTVLLNINNTTPNLEHVLADKLTDLMCEFIEGKVSIKNIGNDDMTFVQLSDSFVDCAPNEDGLDSWFDILHLATPTDFLENLAKQLQSMYALDVSVVDGEKCGLILRRQEST